MSDAGSLMDDGFCFYEAYSFLLDGGDKVEVKVRDLTLPFIPSCQEKGNEDIGNASLLHRNALGFQHEKKSC